MGRNHKFPFETNEFGGKDAWARAATEYYLTAVGGAGKTHEAAEQYAVEQANVDEENDELPV